MIFKLEVKDLIYSKKLNYEAKYVDQFILEKLNYCIL